MVKNLIRNGGFERNTTDFWTATDAKSFGAVGSPVHKGSYAGKVVCNGANHPYVMPNDYIPLAVGEMLYLELWLRVSDADQVRMTAEYYDENLDLVATTPLTYSTQSTTAYERTLTAISGLESAMYVKPKILYEHSTVDHYMMLDNVLCYKLDPTSTSARALILFDINGAQGAGTVVGEYIFSAPFREAEFTIDVLAFTGSSPTMDLTIETREWDDVAYHTIASFTQETGGASQQVLIVTAGVGMKMRFRRIFGGTVSDCNIELTALLKR